MSQTGGGCQSQQLRGSFAKSAQRHWDMEQIPVISVNMAGLEKNPGFKIVRRR